MKSAKAIFEAELERRGVTFSALDEPGLYQVEVGSRRLTISLDNIDRDYRRDKESEGVVRFVDRVLRTIDIPPWTEARNMVYWAAEAADVERGDTIHVVVSETVIRLLVLADLDEGTLTWIVPSTLSAWGVTEEEVGAAALANLDSLLAGKAPEVSTIDGMTLGMVPVASAFKASLIFAPSWKRFVEAKVGWPVLVVIPCRDFVYVMPETHQALLGRMGAVVQREYRESGYPITTEVLRISDDGIEAIGRFPE